MGCKAALKIEKGEHDIYIYIIHTHVYSVHSHSKTHEICIDSNYYILIDDK